MANQVRICNLALSNIGDRARVTSINPPDGSVQADHCANFYPVALDQVQAEGDWTFCRTRTALTEVTNPLTSWAFAYSVPNDCLHAVKVLLPGESDEAEGQAFTLETNEAGASELYTNVEDAVLIYRRRETDTNRFSPGFVNVLSWLLASFIAGPVLKGKTGTTVRENSYNMYLALLPRAQATNMNQGKQQGVYGGHTPGWMSDR